jgi:hypothetical protein
MNKRWIAWFLVFSFLNFVIMPTFVSAKTYYGEYPNVSEDLNKAEKERNERIIIGSLVILVVTAVIYFIVKAKKAKQLSSSSTEIVKSKESSSSSTEPKELEEPNNQNQISPKAYDELLASTGNIVVFRW